MKTLRLTILALVFLGLTGCVGVGYYDDHWSVNVSPYAGFFMFPWFFGYYGYGGHYHSHGPTVYYGGPYVYRRPLGSPPHAGGPKHH